MENLIKNIVVDTNGVLITRRITESYFRKNYPELCIEIDGMFVGLPFNAKLYMLYYNISEIPKCLVCGGNVKFEKFSLGFYKHCSKYCVGVDKNVQKTKEDTTMLNYGVKYTLQSKTLVKRIRETNLEKYGNEVPQRTNIIKQKIVDTNIKIYGSHPSKTSENKEKRKHTNMVRYGVENSNQRPEIRNKTKQTNIDRYGFENPMCNEVIKNKTKDTNLDRYGHVCAMQSTEIKEKIQENNVIKFGCKIPSQNEEVKKKITKSIGDVLNLKSIEFWINKLNLNDGDVEIIDDDITITNHCNIHNKFTIDRSLLKCRTGAGIKNLCTLCNPLSENVSIKENEVIDFINKELGVETTKRRINNSEIDMFIPSHNIGIEFNGLYWHSDKFKSNDYHLNKTNMCENSGIELLHIFEDEWIYQYDIIKSVIKSKLNIFDRIIDSKECEIKMVSSNDCEDFLFNNDIRGHVLSKIKIGLYYENALVSILILNERLNNTFEILRYCNLINTKIVGGFNMLMEFFMCKYKPKSIRTVVDRRFSQCEDLVSYGFFNIGILAPDFYYLKLNKPVKHNKHKFKKSMLIKEGFDKNKTVDKIMKERGFTKIYDSGSILFEFICLLE